MTVSEPIISLQNLSREFAVGDGKTIEVLKDITLDLAPGSFNVIRGESGSGKTSLLRILGMLDSGFGGEYRFGDVSIGDQPDWYLDELRANNLGFIFQEGRLFGHMTLRKNIEVPLELHGYRERKKIDDRISDLAPRFYSGEEIAKDTLGQRPSRASGGQAQRASIMRAMVTKPSVILADEPTASLHGDLKKEVVEHLVSLSTQGHTVVVVSHDSVFYGIGRQLELNKGVLTDLRAAVAAPAEPSGSLVAAADLAPEPPAAEPLPMTLPGTARQLLAGWMPRAPLGILFRQALRETLFRPIFLSLILVSLIAGVCQVSVFSSVIVGAQAYVDQKITEGSRLNRIQIKPRLRDLEEDDRFPTRAEIAALPPVLSVVPRRATTTRVVTTDGSAKVFSVTGLHEDDPEYDLLAFLAGGGFTEGEDRPEVILTAALVGEAFDTTALEDGTADYDDFIGESVTILVNRFNRQRELVAQTPVELELKGIILNGEGGRQLYFPNRTLLMFDALVQDRIGRLALPENAGVSNWPEAETIAEWTDFPWEDSLHVYSREIKDVLPLFGQLSRLGYKPQSDIWDYKWALDIQDTAWRVFVPLLILIVLTVAITVAANIFTSAKLRETELALWRVLGMRRGDLVLTQVTSSTVSVLMGALAGLALGMMLVTQTRTMLQNRSLETAAATGEQPQDYDAIFAPVGNFFWEIVLAALVIGILASLWPAIRTAKADPAKVLQS